MLSRFLPTNIDIVASGGVATPDHVVERQEGGAKATQVWTGFIYYGPAIVKDSLERLSSRRVEAGL